jgi:hypothetical protein
MEAQEASRKLGDIRGKQDGLVRQLKDVNERMSKVNRQQVCHACGGMSSVSPFPLCFA